MKVKMGHFANGFAWFVEHEGQILEQGHDLDGRKAKKDAQDAAMFWMTHDYEFED